MRLFRYTRGEERAFLATSFERNGDGYAFYRHHLARGIPVTAEELESYLRPPLDGSRIMAWLLPPGLRSPYLSIERFGLILIFGLIFLGPRLSEYGVPNIGNWIWRGMQWVESGIAGIAAVFGVR